MTSIRTQQWQAEWRAKSDLQKMADLAQVFLSGFAMWSITLVVPFALFGWPLRPAVAVAWLLTIISTACYWVDMINGEVR